MSRQGLYFSITLNTAAGVTFEARSGRNTKRYNTSSNVVLPQPLVGELMLTRGEKRKCSARNVRKFLSGIRRCGTLRGANASSSPVCRLASRPKASWIP